MLLSDLSPSAGIGLKPEHYRSALEARADGLWFEVHPENYMVEGGPRLRWLDAIREIHPLSLHGVAMSLGGPDRPDPAHLDRWSRLISRYQPVRISEHLAWSALDDIWFADLLPVRMTRMALDRFCRNVDIMQTRLGRQVLIENPARYVWLNDECDEADFLAETVKRTGCGLLLDVNNLHISAHNLGIDARDWLRRIPVGAVGEIHLAGHEVDSSMGEALLIDTHGAEIAPPVWRLFETVIAATGPRPTLIERDTHLPDFNVLIAERDLAQAQLTRLGKRAPLHV
ncbi:DUF692 domain-containing protein [Maricaulis sp.]|uniref:MNIO family bufferin maturase n=1 Tax=Maricaulis sp. TaxID=1486257 RepID=UPI0025B91DCB|nr:DUF692 domain-containing protein [Maricaulis sp.]